MQDFFLQDEGFKPTHQTSSKLHKEGVCPEAMIFI
jgi:hypothetical protein